MGTNINDVIAALPENERAAVNNRYDELRLEVDSLRELRLMAKRAQADIAKSLRIKQPSVSKIEKQGDLLLSTLRSYVEAVGGSLNLTVELPNKPAIKLRGFGEIAQNYRTKAAPVVTKKNRKEEKRAVA